MTDKGSQRMIIHHILNLVTVIDNKTGTSTKSRQGEIIINLDSQKTTTRESQVNDN